MLGEGIFLICIAALYATVYQTHERRPGTHRYHRVCLQGQMKRRQQPYGIGGQLSVQLENQIYNLVRFFVIDDRKYTLKQKSFQYFIKKRQYRLIGLVIQGIKGFIWFWEQNNFGKFPEKQNVRESLSGVKNVDVKNNCALW